MLRSGATAPVRRAVLAAHPEQHVVGLLCCCAQEQPHLYGALYALRILSNKYEFKDLEDRKPMQDVVNTTFPALLQIFQVRSGGGLEGV